MKKFLSTAPLLGVALLAASTIRYGVFDATNPGNDNSSMIPTLWANESLVVLEENMIVGAMVYRDFENTFANYGDTVNTRKPNEFVGKRKTDTDDVTIQSATSTNIPVPLNQWIHVSFVIKDGERTKAFKDLVAFYLEPALIAEASLIDKIICSQTIQFIANNAGQLGQLSSTTTSQFTLEAREVLNNNKVPDTGTNRMMVVGTKADTQYNLTPLFVKANESGDGGLALRSARMGKLHGFQFYSCQNQPYVKAGSTTVAFQVNLAAGYAIGATTMVIDTGTTILGVGAYFTVAGDYVPQRITAHTETSSATTSVTFTPGLSHAVVDNAVITTYTPYAISQASSLTAGTVTVSSGYPAGWAKPMTLSAFTPAPIVGQPVNFGDGNVYCIVQIDTVNSQILIDRPLVATIANSVAVNVGPAGSYNLAFTRNALALVVRPLQPPEDGMGARSAFVEHNSFAVRVTMAYLPIQQGHLVTVDALCGVTVLDSKQGCVMLG